MPNWTHAEHLRSASRGLIYVLAFILPLVAFPFTSESLELNKQTVLLLFTFASAIFWLGSQLTDARCRLRRGLANLLPVVWLAAFLVPALSSISPYLSWVGAHRQEYTSVLTALSFAILALILAHTLDSRRSHKWLHTIFLASTSLVAILALLSFFGLPVFQALHLTLAFNTVGTLTNFTVFLIVMNAMFVSAFLSHRPHDSLLHDGTLGGLERALIFAVAAITFFFLLVLDYWPLWLLWSVSMAIPFVFVFFRANDFPSQKRLLFPLALLLPALPFWFLLGGLSFAHTPLEVTPNVDASLTIAQRTLQTTSSQLGSGPGTYAIDYARFHDEATNATDYWDTRFDRANSFALTALPMLGVFGAALLSLYVFILLFKATVQILCPSPRAQWLESFVHTTPWLVLVISAFLFPWGMTLMGSFAIFSGLLMSQTMGEPHAKALRRAPVVSLAFSLAFGLVSFVFLVGIFATAQRYMAEVAFARALEVDKAGGSGQEMVKHLDRAARLNKYHDTFYRSLGEALLLRVQEELSKVGGADTLTASSSQYVQALVASVVNAHTRATELSPMNSGNWLARGRAYRELIPVMGEAAQFAVESHERAAELEPVNPRVVTELGRTYMAAAQALRPLTASADATAAQAARTQFVSRLTQAHAAFDRAIALKPTYAPAHFELALVYEAQGKMHEAVKKMEAVAQYNPLDVGVYFQLGMLYLRRAATWDVERAQTALERAIELSPTYSNAHWFLASIYEGQGDLAAAVREVEVVLTLNPGNTLVGQRLERLLRGDVSETTTEAIE